MGLKYLSRITFHSLSAWVFASFLLCFVGIGAMMYNIQAAVSNFEYVLSLSCLAFVVIAPILTMRVLAEERRQKTDQLLYALPDHEGAITNADKETDSPYNLYLYKGLPPTPIAQKAPKIMMSKMKMTVLMFSPLDHARVMEEKVAHVTPAISAKKKLRGLIFMCSINESMAMWPLPKIQ